MKTKLLLLSLFCTGALAAQQLSLELFAEGFNSPIEVVHAGDDRLFVAQQGGVVKVLNADGSTNGTNFLDISALTSPGGERGLLGLAFHPDYADNGYFFINYTNTSGNTVIARYSVSETDADVADAGSAEIILTVNQPASNHNGGCLRFGPDGYLYISMGDGGGAGDTNNNGQNTNTLLGKMLRLDVDSGLPYSIPATNPFADGGGAGEVWAYGLRNAWKFSFNRLNNDLWIADVGQNAIEEINRVDSSESGYNFGWRCFEGSQVYNSDGCSLTDMYTMPIAEYTHAETGGCSITGGYVYTGTTYDLQDIYIFADYCNNKLGMVDTEGNVTYTNAFGGNNFAAFGEDINGELYVAGKSSGDIFKITGPELSTKNLEGSAFSIYPNPASDVVYIQQKGSGSYASHLDVYDMSGKLLMSRGLENTEINTIATSSLPAGLYLVNLKDANGNTSAHKLSIK